MADYRTKGLITGATSAYLVEPDSLDLGAKKRIAVTQSHECAHMWYVTRVCTPIRTSVHLSCNRFGNITTMQWWDNLYLNEGFASLVCQVSSLLHVINLTSYCLSSDGRGNHPW